MPLAGPVCAPGEPTNGVGFDTGLAQAARRMWPRLMAADTGCAVAAGELAQAVTVAESVRQARDDGPASPGADRAGPSMGARTGAACAAGHHGVLPVAGLGLVGWGAFSAVVPVLASSPGAGASVLAAALADVLALAGWRTLLVDTADPPRSGLAMAADTEGPDVVRVHPEVGLRFSWRAGVLLARIQTALPLLAPGMVPPPPAWCPPGMRAQATVVDIGHDAWRAAADPLSGAGAWLRRGTPASTPLLVVRPTRPALVHAEQVLARLEPWVRIGAAAPIARLVVMGARKWPNGVAGAAGRRVAGLLPEAVFVPYDRALAASGVTPELTPARLRRAATPLLRCVPLGDGEDIGGPRRGLR